MSSSSSSHFPLLFPFCCSVCCDWPCLFLCAVSRDRCWVLLRVAACVGPRGLLQHSTDSLIDVVLVGGWRGGGQRLHQSAQKNHKGKLGPSCFLIYHVALILISQTHSNIKQSSIFLTVEHILSCVLEKICIYLHKYWVQLLDTIGTTKCSYSTVKFTLKFLNVEFI